MSNDSMAALAGQVLLPMDTSVARRTQEKIESKPIADLTAEELHQAMRPVNSGLLQARAQARANTPRVAYNRKEVVTCDVCGGKFQRANRSQHRKSEKHARYSKIQNQFLRLLWWNTDTTAPSGLRYDVVTAAAPTTPSGSDNDSGSDNIDSEQTDDEWGDT